MRVAVVHSFYRSDLPSGENVAVEQQIRALERAGVDVVPVFRWTDRESRRPLYSVRSAVRLSTGLDGGNLPEVIAGEEPDLVHIHNLFPNFGTRWLRGLTVPVVSTLHNFRFACANGLLFRDGHLCLECPTHGSIRALRHRCYQDSWAASLPAAIATAGGVGGNRILSASRVVITQSRRVHDYLVGSGVPEDRLSYIPGFVERRSGEPLPPPATPRFVFVGRPTPEKGLDELIRLWPVDVPLDIVGGDAPRTGTAPKRITFLGRAERNDLVAQLPGYTALVFPGLVWEGAYPLVVREALEAGIPVVAREGTGASDLVLESAAGAVYAGDDGDDLKRALAEVMQRNGDLRKAARHYFEGHLTEDRWAAATLRAYEGAVQGRSRPSSG